MTLEQLRPRSATELVDAAVQLARRHYQPLLLLSALLAIPNAILGLVAQFVAPQQPGSLSGQDLVIVPLAFISLCWFAITLGALIASTSAAYVDGQPLEPLAAVRTALRRAGRLIGGNLVASIIVFILAGVVVVLLMIVVGLVVAIAARGQIPDAIDEAMAGIIGLGAVVIAVIASLLIWSRYVNVTAAIILEDRGAMASLRRSAELVKGRVWATTGFVTIAVVLWMAAYFTFLLIAQLILRSTELAANVAGFLVLVLYPVLAALLTLLYYDLRIRREGYDIELMAQAMDRPPGVEAPL